MNGHPFRAVGPAEPRAFPMACVCGNAQGVLVDTLFDRNPIGRVYWCLECFGEMARLFEVVAKAGHDLVQERLDVALGQLEHVTGELGETAGERDVAVRKLEEAEVLIAPLRSERDQLHHDLVELSRQLTDARNGGASTREWMAEARAEALLPVKETRTRAGRRRG